MYQGLIVFDSSNVCSAVVLTIVECLPSVFCISGTGLRSDGSFRALSTCSIALFFTNCVVVKSIPKIIGGSPAMKNAQVYEPSISYIQPE